MVAISKNPTTSGHEPTKLTNSNLAEAFKGPIRKGSPEAASIVLIFIRTLIAMVVPAGYIGLLGVVSYFTFYHALFGLHFNQGATFPIAASLYILPLLSGLTLATLMLRPFFPLLHSNEHRLKLNSFDGAEFLQLVSLIQQRLNDEFDVHIELSMLPVVSIEPCVLSLKPNQTINLVIGLPLVQTMTTQQLSALICHELAHYSHQSHRRAFRWTILVDKWFDDCVQGRDGWKAYYEDLKHTGSNSLYVICGIIGTWAVLISDTTLRYLQDAFQFLSDSTMKQLDRDADQSAVLLSGSKAYAESLELLCKSTKAWQVSQARLLHSKTPELVDNFVDDVSISLETEQVEHKADMAIYTPISWKYHRETAERIDYALHEDVTGIFHLKTAASDLFNSFSEICKSITPLYYRECGLEFSLSSLKPSVTNVLQKATEDNYRMMIDDYTSSTFSESIVWDVNNASKMTKMSSEQICNILNTSIRNFRSELPRYQEAHIHFVNTERDVVSSKLVNLRFEHGLITQDQLVHQTESSNAKKAMLNNQAQIFSAYSRCIGLRIAAAVLLDRQKQTLVKTLTLLSNLQLLFQLQQPIMQGRQLSLLVGGLTNHLYSGQEIALKAPLDLYTKKLNDINCFLFSTLCRLPGNLKNEDTMEKYLHNKKKLRLKTGTDGTTATLEFFTLLEEEFYSLNTITTGRLVEFAVENELANNIEPVRIVLKPQLDASA